MPQGSAFSIASRPWDTQHFEFEGTGSRCQGRPRTWHDRGTKQHTACDHSSCGLLQEALTCGQDTASSAAAWTAPRLFFLWLHGRNAQTLRDIVVSETEGLRHITAKIGVRVPAPKAQSVADPGGCGGRAGWGHKRWERGVEGAVPAAVDPPQSPWREPFASDH